MIDPYDEFDRDDYALLLCCQVTISKECLGGREGWIIGRPPNRVLYGQPGNMNLPPELHWSLLNGGSGQNPPPTLMMHSLRRAKEVREREKEIIL